MKLITRLFRDALHLFYPHTCCGCGSDLLPANNLLCLSCLHELPHTHFARLPGNPAEKLFTGRVALEAAFSELYFSKGGLVQQLVHQLKYKGHTAIGHFLGELMGQSLLGAERLMPIDYLVPLPLFADKEYRRGYNQSGILCAGMHSKTLIPVSTGNLIRKRATETQTRKHRTARWTNVAGSFYVNEPSLFENRHLLLVDDVVTTGATLDACGQVLLAIPGVRLSIATLAIA